MSIAADANARAVGAVVGAVALFVQVHPSMPTPIDTSPYWSNISAARYPPLAADAVADVVVVGGGVTGLTTAYLLAKEGRRVVLLERDRLAGADTGHTTAHLTMVTDLRLKALVKAFGRPHAQAVWDAGLAALGTIADIVEAVARDVGFEWVDGYLHAAATDTAATLRQDAELAEEFGFDAELVDDVPLVGGVGVRYPDQARIHPRRYLAAVADAIVALGGRIHEGSAVNEFRRTGPGVVAGGHTVTCTDVVIATHNPLAGLGGTTGASLFQTKLALYTSYAVAGRVPTGTVPDALWWDTGDPYRYIRLVREPDHDVVILGGEDHKTGQEADTMACYQRLEAGLRSLIPGVSPVARWSGQVIETADGLPYIGQSAEHQYTATGFAGNGFTFGTAAAMMITDAIVGRANPWAELFEPGRKALTRGLWDYLKENADYPYYMIRDRFAGAEAKSLRAVGRGTGCVVDRKGVMVAAYRSANGSLTTRSAVCPHLGCLVTWNAAETTWDCPCHGSRFSASGEVISGPAESPLPAVD